MQRDATLFALVRHGNTAWNSEGRIQGRTDVPLDALGREQARRAAAALAAEPWEALYTSPLVRARESAAIIGSPHGLVPTVWPDLQERAYGTLEGLTADEIERLYPDRADRESLPGVEAFSDLQERAVRTFTTLAHRHPGGKVLVVAHGGLLNAFFFHLSGGRVGSGITRLANGSISRVHYAPGAGWAIVELNQIPPAARQAGG